MLHPALNDQSTNIRASDGESLETVAQPVGASVELTDFEVTAPSFTQSLPARAQIKVIGATPTGASINGAFIEITVPAGVTGIVYQRPQWGGQITSYADGDVGYSAANGAYNYNETGDVSACLDYTALDPFYTLKFNNAFGNKYRFTTDDGTPASDGKADFILSDFSTATETYYVIDHLTGLGYMQGKVGMTINWASAMAASNAYSNTYTGWRAISDGEINSVIQRQHLLLWQR
jgi:hypothetical protein